MLQLTVEMILWGDLKKKKKCLSSLLLWVIISILKSIFLTLCMTSQIASHLLGGQKIAAKICRYWRSHYMKPWGPMGQGVLLKSLNFFLTAPENFDDTFPGMSNLSTSSLAVSPSSPIRDRIHSAPRRSLFPAIRSDKLNTEAFEWKILKSWIV